MTTPQAPDTAHKTSRSFPPPNRRSAPTAALKAVGTRPRRVQLRPTKQASYELTNHAKAYLEGGQYASGFDFLISLLAAGTSISTPAQPYVGFLAPPAYIAFAASVIVDPKYNTKAQSKDVAKGSDAALRYLRCVHATIDSPAYPTIRKAFTFPGERNRRRAPGYRSAQSPSPRLNGDVEQLAGEHANEKSMWYRADDFWHIVGWTFNCSVAHKGRWDRWKLWLSIMLDFLETDWDVCVKESNIDETDQAASLQDSLIWHFIIGNESMHRGRRRRIVKAILATATEESVKDYPEIWEKEAAEIKRKKDKDQPLGEVDFETGELADYESDEEMLEEEEGVDETSKHTTIHGTMGLEDAMEHLGGQDAIELRQRLIALLAQVAQALPKSFTTLSDFFDNILEDFIHLPTMIFEVLLSTLNMPGRLSVAFSANLLLPLVSNKPPEYFTKEPTQENLEKKHLPLKGTTQSFASNAKVSLILEQMIIYMMSQDTLTPTKALRSAMETGIAARQKVLGTGKGKKGNADEEEQAKKLMEACSERLLGLLEILEISKGLAPQPLDIKTKAGGKSALLSFGSGSSLSPAPESETDEDD